MAALHARRGGWLLGAAVHVVNVMPFAGLAAYRMRERFRGVA